MTGTNPTSSQKRVSEIVFQMASGTLAVLGVIALPAVIGYFLDEKIGTFVAMPIGLIVGMICGVVILIHLARKWTPIAKRSANEILDDDTSEDEAEDDAKESR
jgi:F0F1-type ATP synthase assembly protein I